MTDKMNCKDGSRRSGKKSHVKHLGTWRTADAVRFLFKAQCYDAGSDSETRCGLCGKRIRLCYVLKVLETADPLAPEVGKLTVGECCFKPIQAVNEKLYRQLLAAAVNLRTIIEAVERDKDLFGGSADKVEFPQPLPGSDEEVASELFDSLAANGGEHV